MRIFNTEELRPSQLEKIYATLGGRYTFWERLRKKRVGSPMMFYQEGSEVLDQLQNKATDEIRINFELLKDGLLIRIAERTNSYFIPILAKDISTIQLRKDKVKSYLKLTITSAPPIQLWGSIDQYFGWQDFINTSFLVDRLKD